MLITAWKINNNHNNPKADDDEPFAWTSTLSGLA
jgi:hypothetical protein